MHKPAVMNSKAPQIITAFIISALIVLFVLLFSAKHEEPQYELTIKELGGTSTRLISFFNFIIRLSPLAFVRKSAKYTFDFSIVSIFFTKIHTNEREISSLLEYFSQRVQYIFFTQL